jgi:hypothetical protein
VSKAKISGHNVADTQLDQVAGHQGFRLDGLDLAGADYLARGCRQCIKGLDGLFGAIVLEKTGEGLEYESRIGYAR